MPSIASLSYYDNDFVTAENGALETRRWKKRSKKKYPTRK